MKKLLSINRKLSDCSSLFCNPPKKLNQTSSPCCIWFKERYNHLCEGSEDGYAAINKQGIVYEYNQAFKDMLGYSDEELSGVTYKDLTPLRWHRMEKELIEKQILSKQYSNGYEKEFLRKDGTIIPVRLRTYLQKDRTNQITGLWAFIKNITEYELSEKKLEACEKRFYKAFRSSPAPTYIFRISDERFIAVNESGLSLLGYEREEMLGRTGGELSMWDSPRDHNLLISKLLKQGRLHNEMIRLRTKSGELRETFWSCETINLNGENAIISLLYDITGYNRAVDERNESERRLADIIDFLPDATFVIDLQGKVIAWNRAIEEMTGVKATDMLGKGAYEYALPFYGIRRPIFIDLIFGRNANIAGQYENIVETDTNLLIGETPVPRLNGGKRIVWAKASPLYDNKGVTAGAIESIRDITDRKHAENTIRNSEKDLAIKARELEDMNVALRVLLRQKENDRKEIEDSIVSNITISILPQLEKLKKNMNNRKYLSNIDILENRLKDICAPFVHKLSSKYLSLTKRELQIAELIKEGKASKAIAASLNISQSAVNMHRYRIRQKLNIKKKQSLKVYVTKYINEQDEYRSK
jgi:PAS domain S-box-containing protein